ncbi:hypothetical protein SUSAZ_04870 [Sulfolobus acidocaldarius SUSAZ]|nr:hypothetical protein SUSAZ_04870 [Sulfolobus acidocaldarius SUSAZ]
MTYRISVLGVKGGIGKSTIALSLGKALALKGKRVLLIERDMVGYASFALGIKAKGILAKLSDGEENFGESFKKLSFGDGELALLKLYGDGERVKDDLNKVMSDTSLREKLNILANKFLPGYEYYITDNPPLISYNDLTLKVELELFYSIMPNPKVLRIFVSSASRNIIDSTIHYLKTFESDVNYKGVPLAFIINMIPSLDEVDRIKQKLREIVTELGVVYGIAIPLYREIVEKSQENILDLPVVDEINYLAENIINERFQNRTVYISAQRADALSGVTLITQEPGGMGVLSIINSINKAIEEGSYIVVVYTKERIAETLKSNGVKFIGMSILPKYREERFKMKTIADVLKLAHRLANDITYKIQDFENSVIILYRTNDISPAVDNTAYLDEFWNAFINSIRNKKNVKIVFICDRIKDECDVVKSYADKVIEV